MAYESNGFTIAAVFKKNIKNKICLLVSVFFEGCIGTDIKNEWTPTVDVGISYNFIRF